MKKAVNSTDPTLNIADNPDAPDKISRTNWLYRCSVRYHEQWGYPLAASSKLAMILLSERGGRLSATPEADVDRDIEKIQAQKKMQLRTYRKREDKPSML